MPSLYSGPLLVYLTWTWTTLTWTLMGKTLFNLVLYSFIWAYKAPSSGAKLENMISLLFFLYIESSCLFLSCELFGKMVGRKFVSWFDFFVFVFHRTQVCPNCDTKFPTCIVSGRPLMDYQFWMCGTCKHRAYEQEISALNHCPLCHAPVWLLKIHTLYPLQLCSQSLLILGQKLNVIQVVFYWFDEWCTTCHGRNQL